MTLKDVFDAIEGLDIPEAVKSLDGLLEKFPDAAPIIEAVKALLAQYGTAANMLAVAPQAFRQAFDLVLHGIGPVNRDGGLTA